MGHPLKTGQTWGTSSTTPPSAKRGRKGRAPDCTVGQLERQLRNRLHRDPSTPLRFAQDDTAKTRAKTKATATARLRWRVLLPTSGPLRARHGAPMISIYLIFEPTETCNAFLPPCRKKPRQVWGIPGELNWKGWASPHIRSFSLPIGDLGRRLRYGMGMGPSLRSG